MYDEITPLIEEQLIDADNYKEYFIELNRKYNLSQHDYSLFIINNLFQENVSGTYKEFLKQYIIDELNLSFENEQ